MKITILILALSLLGYHFNLLTAQKPITINIESGIETQKELTISKITDNIQYIPLETNEHSLISYIDNLKTSRHHIFVKTFNPWALYCFDRAGNFLNQIGKQGRGPNEYNFFGGFGINNLKNEAYIYGLEPSKILVHSFTGNFKKKLNWPDNRIDHFYDMEFISNEHFIIMQSNERGNTPFSYEIYSISNKLIKKAIKPVQYKMKGVYGTKYEFSYFTVNNSFYVKENLLNDTLYKLTPSLELIPQYIFDSGKYKCPVKLRQEFMSFFENNKLKYFQPLHIFDSQSYLIFFYIFNKKKYYGFYQKSNKETYTFQSNGIYNDYDGGVDFQPIYQRNNELIGYVNAMDLIDHVNSKLFKNSTPKYPEKKKELEKLANSLNENDNPVLMLVKLKE